MSAGAGFSQAHAALRKANHVRTARRQIKNELASGERTLVGLIADPPDEILSATTIEVLMWMPGIGETRARKLLTRPSMVVAPQVKVGHLSAVTRRRLCARLEGAEPVKVAA